MNNNLINDDPNAEPFPDWLKPQKGIVLIDDDPDFLTLMSAFAKPRDIKLDCFLSLSDMPSFAQLKNYDLAIIDYQLDVLVGTEIAEYIDIFFSSIPVILISGGQKYKEHTAKQPKSIKSFISKAQGPSCIFNEAFRILEDVRFNELFHRRTSQKLCKLPSPHDK